MVGGGCFLLEVLPERRGQEVCEARARLFAAKRSVRRTPSVLHRWAPPQALRNLRQAGSRLLAVPGEELIEAKIVDLLRNRDEMLSRT
jgi:hypothetical protein